MCVRLNNLLTVSLINKQQTEKRGDKLQSWHCLTCTHVLNMCILLVHLHCFSKDFYKVLPCIYLLNWTVLSNRESSFSLMSKQQVSQVIMFSNVEHHFHALNVFDHILIILPSHIKQFLLWHVANLFHISYYLLLFNLWWF